MNTKALWQELAKWILGAAIVGIVAYTVNGAYSAYEKKTMDPCAHLDPLALVAEHKSLQDLILKHKKQQAWRNYQEAKAQAAIQYRIDIDSAKLNEYIEAQIKRQVKYQEDLEQRQESEFQALCRTEYPEIYSPKSQQSSPSNRAVEILGSPQTPKEIILDRCLVTTYDQGYAARQAVQLCDCMVDSIGGEFNQEEINAAVQSEPDQNGSKIERRLYQALSSCRAYLSK